MPRTLRQWAGLAPVTTLDEATTALLLIDFQEEYFKGSLPLSEGPSALARAERLLAWARNRGLGVLHVQHVAPSADSPLFAPGSPPVALRREVAPREGEAVIQKTLPSSFAGTPLHATLQDKGIRTLVLGGLMTHMCVSSTARAALSFGYRVIVVSDACATRDLPSAIGPGAIDHASIHAAALAALADRFADVLASEELMRLAGPCAR